MWVRAGIDESSSKPEIINVLCQNRHKHLPGLQLYIDCIYSRMMHFYFITLCRKEEKNIQTLLSCT